MFVRNMLDKTCCKILHFNGSQPTLTSKWLFNVYFDNKSFETWQLCYITMILVKIERKVETLLRLHSISQVPRPVNSLGHRRAINPEARNDTNR